MSGCISSSTGDGRPLFDSHLQMAFIERDQRVEAPAPQASAQRSQTACALGPNGNSEDSHSEAHHSLVQPPGQDGVGVPVADHETIGMIARKLRRRQVGPQFQMPYVGIIELNVRYIH